MWLPEENQFEPGFPSIRNLIQKKKDFSNEVIAIQTKINDKLSDTYGDNVPLINLTAPAKPRTKSQIRQGVQKSQELNENVNWLLAYSEKKILDNLSKTIEESKKNYIRARNVTNAYNFNVQLSKITLEQWTNLVENYKYNVDLLNRLIDEQAKKDIKAKSSEINPEDNPLITSQFYKTLSPTNLPSDSKVYTGNEFHFGTFEFGYGTIWTSEKFPNNLYIEISNSNIGVIKKSDLKDAILKSNSKENRKIEQQSQFESLKQKALDKKAELEKNYGKIEEEVKQTLEIEMNYFTPLVHHLIQKHINQYGKDFPMYFSGYQITKLTQGNDRTAWIYAGKDEIDIVKINDFKIGDKGYSFNADLKYIPLGFTITDYSKDKYLGKSINYRNINGEYSKLEESKVTNITEQEYNKAKQEYEKAYQQATERRAKEIKFEAANQIGLYDNIERNHTSSKYSIIQNGREIILHKNINTLEEAKEYIENHSKTFKYDKDSYEILTSKERNSKNLSDKELDEGIKILNDYKKKSKQNLDRVINTIMNISNNKPIETGAIYNAMSQVSGIKLIWQDKIEGLRGNTGGYLVDLTNYNYNTPILYGLNTSKVVPIENYLNQFGFNTEQLDDLKQLTGYSEYNKNDENSNNLQSTESILETNPKLKKFIEDITDEDGSISLFKYNKIINDKEKFGNLPVMKTITKLNNILKNAVNRLWDNRINAENNLKIKFVESLEDEDAVAQFLRKENEIHISKNIFLNILDKDFKDYPEFYTGYLLNHELIHYLTPQSLSIKPQFIDRLLLNEKSDMYLKNLYEREFVKNIKNLYNFSISQLEDLSDYGFTNLAEFVTEAMSNPGFQVKLSTIKYKNENKSLWKKFIKILSDYLSSITGNSIEDTVLEAVISEVTNYITENSNIERTYKTKINNSGDTQFYFVFNKNSEIGIEQEEINNYDNSDNENFEFNEDLTGNEYIENIDNKYLIKFEELLNKGVITQICN